ncbi:hypothetical protein CBR_g49762 [Chara braunii]|uniref:RING-type domain-containing protein n=1 Tax=Chara braunii TaxID=69332 RepID=A0A388M612_CHABU|nr:hypothetical protein CBR_g49762 [Chara braunii]|eukprot:GBG89912.1 hypothetical protein CBR_g49762 [Chara braunii]
MVVCKCRKATKLYCFVHKLPVCVECVCSDEHRLCVVRTYSEWVVDGDYDWPPRCPVCEEILDEQSKPNVTRLSCLHVLHDKCLQKHLEIFPPYTAPAGFTCPACKDSVWPPKNPKDVSSTLSARIREVVAKSSVGQTILGGDMNLNSTTKDAQPPPSAFSTAPLSEPQVNTDSATAGAGPSTTASVYGNGEASRSPDSAALPTDSATSDMEDWSDRGRLGRGSLNGVAAAAAEAEKAAASVTAAAPGAKSALPTPSPSAPQSSWMGPQVAAVARKVPARGERHSMDVEDDHRDPDRSEMKYARRGTWYSRFIQQFSSPSKSGLPVAIVRKDSGNAEELITGEGRRSRKSRKAAVDPRRVLLGFAIMSCMATMLLLYFRLAQRHLVGHDDPDATV